LEFKEVRDGLVSYQLKNNANGDSWKNIYVIYNANPTVEKFVLEPGSWNIAVYNDRFSHDKGYKAPPGMLRIPAISMVVLYQK
jgi:pullulanase